MAENNKKTFILGLGNSGQATARYLCTQNAPICVWDDNLKEFPPDLAPYQGNPATLDWQTIGLVIKSPGIPMEHPAIQAAQAAGCTIGGDLDLLPSKHPNASFIGITGTNGKSTVTALCHHVLHAAGYNVQMGGNIGAPVLDLPPADIYVLEISSFQLETLHHLPLAAAAMLNVTPDHLDRHGTFEHYKNIKYSIFSHLQPGGTRVDGPAIPPLPADLPHLPGPHNRHNAACAQALCQSWVNTDNFQKYAATFQPLPHRMATVATCHNIQFVNDSKATNAEATIPALQAYKNIYWICGGTPKADGITPCLPHLHNIRQAFTIGQSGTNFANMLQEYIPVTCSEKLENAVKAAYEAARHNAHPSVILLSPAAASYDQFPHFMARGDAFTTCAQNICQEAAT